MIKIGYALSSEEHGPLELCNLAAQAEQSGFSFALISDHYHPWTSRQPHSPFVWSTLGGLAHTTRKLPIGTGVTCPFRIHPAILAQAAATTGAMLEGRFFLGLGTGENLNEHILGDRWPPLAIRQEMLEEAVGLIRQLWKGKNTTHYGKHFTVEDARIFTLPRQLPAIAIAASGEDSASLAGRLGDALISTAPKQEVVEAFRDGGGGNKPCYGQVTVCYASSEEEGRKTAHEWWPNAALPGQLSQEIRTVEHFDGAVKSVTPDQVAEGIVCGPDPKAHIDCIKKFIEAGFDHVYVHQVGPQQKEFFAFYKEKVLPQWSSLSLSR